MAQGLQCWNSEGELILDITDRLTRVLGSFDTGTSSGSLVDDNLLTGTPWFNIYLVDNVSERTPCTVSFSGNVLSWSNTSVSYHIDYGVY